MQQQKEIIIPDVLNQGQQESFKALADFILDKDQNVMMLLEGYAGTGKTFLMSKFIETFLNSKIVRSVAMTAPTNKAVKVLSKMSTSMKKLGVEFLTVHKLLGLKEIIYEDGTVKFEQDATSKVCVDEFDIIVVDEVSMLHDELFKELLRYSGHVKFIFTGDSAQIPPVGLIDSIPLLEEQRDKHYIGRTTLSEIVRQKNGNPIIEIATNIRENLKESWLDIPEKDYLNDEGHGMIYLGVGLPEDREKLQKLLLDLFVSDEFKEDADYAKVLAWRNVTVGSFNNIIRNLIYSEAALNGELYKIMKGEKLMAASPIIADYNIIVYATNDEFEVEDYTIHTKTIATDEEAIRLSYYRTTVFQVDAQGKKQSKRIDILHEDSQEDFTKAANALKKYAMQCPGADRKKAWVKYYGFLRSFADVVYSYALTSHRSQGSTYRHVFIAEDDINMNRNVVERNRIKYTAYTRASEKVYRIKR